MKRNSNNPIHSSKRSKGKGVPLPSPPPAPATKAKLSTAFVNVLMGIKSTKRAPNRTPDILAQLKKYYNLSSDAKVIDGVSEEDVVTAIKWHAKLTAVPAVQLKKDMVTTFSGANVKDKKSCIIAFLSSPW